MPTPITLNEKPAAVTTRDRLDFVLSTTLSLTPWKDQDHGFVQQPAAQFKPR